MLLIIKELWNFLLSSSWLAFGLGPQLAYVMGYFFTAIPLEIVIRSDTFRLVSYSSKESRKKAMERTLSQIPLKDQMKLIFWVVFGPTPLISLVGSVYIFSYLYDISDDTDLNRKFNSDISPLKSFVEFMLLQIVGDFFLYWGHRIQHEIPSLWEHHKLHHTLETPSPLGTLYIDSLDASLQGAIPILLAIAIVRPHLLMVYVYIFCRISENVLNHSGLDSVLVDTLTLKVLPGRASIAHHDSHHKFSNYPKGAKNYGENFIFWDYLFGTLRKNNLNID